MMNFRLVKNAIVEIFGNAESNQYRTIGFQRQNVAADTIVGNLRAVQVYYAQGEFPRTSARVAGDMIHNVTYNIDIKVSEAAKVNLSLLNDPLSTQEQRAEAIESFQESSYLADVSFDEIVDILYQTIMDGRNYNLGVEKGIVSDRWIETIRKDEPIPAGEYVILTGSMPLSCRIAEGIPGAIGTPGDIIDTTIISNDDIETKIGKTVLL